jgi:hypothetical protein
MKSSPFILVLALAGVQAPVVAQDAVPKEAGGGRVRYALILPQEKTPEIVKDTERSPFESGQNPDREEGTTEENLVRDILLRMPAVGGASGSQGMRVLLGSMRLVEGGDVPPVIPDQQVALKVKSISSKAIELMWVDKKPTTGPPKILTIPLDVVPKVRHRLPTGAGGAPTAGVGIIRRNGVPVLVAPSEEGFVPPAPSPIVVQDAPEAQEEAMEETAPYLTASTSPEEPQPEVAEPPPTAAPQASVLRMLFGNRPPPVK